MNFQLNADRVGVIIKPMSTKRKNQDVIHSPRGCSASVPALELVTDGRHPASADTTEVTAVRADTKQSMGPINAVAAVRMNIDSQNSPWGTCTISNSEEIDGGLCAFFSTVESGYNKS